MFFIVMLMKQALLRFGARSLGPVGEMKVIRHGYRRIGHLTSGNPAGSHPLDPVPQTVGGSLQFGRHEQLRDGRPN